MQKKLLCLDEDKKVAHQLLSHKKQSKLERINVIYCNLKIDTDIKRKRQKLNHPPLMSHSFLHIKLCFFILHSSNSTTEQKGRQIESLTASLYCTFLLTFLSYSIMGLVEATLPTIKSALVWTLHGLHLSLRVCLLAAAGDPPQTTQWIRAALWSSKGCRRKICYTMVFATCLKLLLPLFHQH